ncbi:hypothetical protein C1646_760982 [Rhizophagus diaphanus]|nr:hypothetical protein C1646_760982 [Rhizophagus diaphanus] [Rhizophagus sp. MUCL 43196]
MGCKILEHHLVLILLIQLFLWITFVNGQFIPGPRSGHTATLIGDKIYFIGGYNYSTIPKESDVFYYDGNKLAWVQVNSQVSGQDADMPLQFGHTANIGGPKQDLIFIIGGDRFSIYLFGGVETDEAGTNIFRNNHYVFDTINLNWKVGGLTNAPPPRFKHTATLVDEIIYYIGGIHMNNSYTTSYASMSIVATGNTPGLRAGHSAVFVKDKICIFGGAYLDSSPTESIAMLDTNNLEWSIPSFINPRRPNMPTLPNLVYHTATLVDKRMLVAFGNDTDIVVNGGYKGLNNNFYIFDFNNNSWYITTADELMNPTSNIPKLFSFRMSSNKPLTIALLSVGIILGVAIVRTVIFIYYRRKKNQSKEDVSYPADDSNISYDKFSFSQ